MLFFKTRREGHALVTRTYQVRKANTAISNVPKRIRDNISSEMGTNGQKEKYVQQQKEQQKQQQRKDEDEEEEDEK
ncbi:uncharacterized protein LOC117791216 isoform X2 [Drosophila innubila]|uniref:uncharacterized protein LOC117791216 isoform X2 n=1 Tax=Drosophila innubila TaxID=198719 RepID=UPI00148D6355|nr:uncharacterized protein LOC117791216 isoform X2 [Drosophila innubila]